jgi:protein-S-isoprenylcysteine O-methyltransferase Ste14
MIVAPAAAHDVTGAPHTSDSIDRPISGAAVVQGALRRLFDRVIPAALFGLLALVQCGGLIAIAGQVPTDGDAAAWIIYVLKLQYRVLALAFLLLLAVLFMIRRTPIGRRARPLPMVLALLGTFIMYLVAGKPLTNDAWSVLAASDLLMVAGLAFTVYAAATLRACFGLAPEARGLVTTGAYRVVRHPLYLGELVVSAGLLLPIVAPTTLAIFGLFCALQAARAALEERVLTESFTEYAAYRQRTPAVLPWPRP